VSSKVRAEVAALLPGERLEYLFPAVIATSYLGNVLIAVTPTSIVVLGTGLFGRHRSRSVVARYSRRSHVGEPDLHGIPSFVLGGIRYELDDEYVAVVSALHLESSTGDPLPPDPLPDL